MIWSAVRLAWREIMNNLLRSGLTVLGIIIGVAAVIAMVTLGGGATAYVSNQISGLGSNLIIIFPATTNSTTGEVLPAPPFKPEDVHAIRTEVTSVSAVAGVVSRSVQAVYGNANRRTQVNGTDQGYEEVRDWQVVEGRSFSDAELRSGRGVCVLGASLRKDLFGAQSPLGEKIRLGQIPCEIIGVLEEKGASALGSDQDNFVLAPLELVQRRISGTRDVELIYASAKTEEARGRAINEITALLRERRHVRVGEPDDFTVRDQKELAEFATSTLGVLTGFLSAIAAISLLVGGIGIMNIMLVSVTERTREIGIRLAIGALERNVLMQFLIEAVLLSSLGGTIGILIGLAVAGAGASLLKMPFVLDPGIVAIAFLFSALVGIVFGYFPARRAAQLDPIEALRYE
ncbi:MAG: ABC transporter permease [Alphaproteobacteria bacterium]|nr:ABC transporter permease [Alphaproteobacteria bacterium]